METSVDACPLDAPRTKKTAPSVVMIDLRMKTPLSAILRNGLKEKSGRFAANDFAYQLCNDCEKSTLHGQICIVRMPMLASIIKYATDFEWMTCPSNFKLL
jgi:hypothetical protein